MYIFYDFETSSRDLIGQILTYAFVVTDSDFNTLEVLEGGIQLRSTELPEVEAILVNRIDVESHQITSDPEYVVAERIFQFLSRLIDNYGECTLVGFNSNRFDLGFLRNLLIHYGYNPYFYGKLKNLDILHFSQFLAFQFPQDFPWVNVDNGDSRYYSFTMEDLSFSFGILTEKQTHSAAEDVALLISLVQALILKYGVALSSFQPVSWFESEINQTGYQLIKVKERHFPQESEDLQHFVYRYYSVIFRDKKQTIVISIDQLYELISLGNDLNDDLLLDAMKSINSNKSFFIAEPISDDLPDGYQMVVDILFQESLIQSVMSKPTIYFDKIKKDWDIDYQIHELGFQNIDRLRTLIIKVKQDPSSYHDVVKTVWDNRTSLKDRYLVQLFNRYFIWTHADTLDSSLLLKYITPRYVSGDMLRNKEEFVSLDDRMSKMESILDSDDYTDDDKHLVHQLYVYYQPIIELLEN